MEEEHANNHDQASDDEQSPSSSSSSSSGNFGIHRDIWEKINVELHSLLKNLLSNLEKMVHIQRSIGEKPNDPEDKIAMSNWLGKLLNLLQRDSPEDGHDRRDEENLTTGSRGVNVLNKDDDDEGLVRPERFKIKPLNAGPTGGPVKEEKKK